MATADYNTPPLLQQERIRMRKLELQKQKSNDSFGTIMVITFIAMLTILGIFLI